MKRENFINVYVWFTFGCGIGWVLAGQPIAAAVTWAGSGIVFVIGIIAKEYFDQLGGTNDSKTIGEGKIP